MTFRDAADIWVPLLAATLGLLPYLMERRRRRQLEDNQRRRVWADVSKVRGLMADVEKDEQPGPGTLQAAGKLSNTLRDLLFEACASEPKLDISVVRKWRASGRLASNWQEQLVLQLLHADEIPDKEVQVLMPVHGRGDELPPEHPMSAR